MLQKALAALAAVALQNPAVVRCRSRVLRPRAGLADILVHTLWNRSQWQQSLLVASFAFSRSSSAQMHRSTQRNQEASPEALRALRATSAQRALLQSSSTVQRRLRTLLALLAQAPPAHAMAAEWELGPLELVLQ